jgi:hypothetical protein
LYLKTISDEDPGLPTRDFSLANLDNEDD